MATKRDLVEAHSFSRRRLVTAFVSGGREVEPSRPGRALVGGVALGVLMVAGAAIAGVFTDRAPSDWDTPGLVISKEQGAAYVILDDPREEDPDALPELRPVINITSAQLILGADRMQPRIIAQETLETRPLGDDIGNLGAPASLPAPADLVQDGWSACTGPDQGVAVMLGEQQGVSPLPAEVASLVDVGSGEGPRYWVVGTAPATDAEPAQAYRYALTSPGDSEGFLRVVGLPGLDQALDVPRSWLALFPRGGDLDESGFGIDRLGESLAGAPGLRVGDYFLEGDRGVLVDADGALQTLPPFALALYSTLVADATGVDEVDPQRLEDRGTAGSGTADSRWPEARAVAAAGERCAVLELASGERPRVQLAGSPVPAASAALVEPGRVRVEVDPGAGAHVASGDWADTSSESLWAIDQKGRASELVGEETPTLLGYAAVDPPLVPDSWIELFDRGVALSREAALCPPGRGEDPECG